MALMVVIYPPPRISATQALQSSEEGKGWKGLVPLRATRRDVEALLGPPAIAGTSSYQTDNENIYVYYANGPCEKGWPYGWNVDDNTVVSITVSPKETVMLSELNFDLNKYQQSRDGHISSRIHYANSSEGITFEVDEFSRRVRSFTYQPTQSQQKFLCPDASNRLPVGRTQADVFSKVDVYGDVAPNMERERLDSVATYLNIRPEAKAYLIAYAGSISQKGEAGARAACARNYLIKKHHIQADRIQAIDGGYRETFQVEVYVEEEDIPLASPTVRPSEVKITQQKSVLTCQVNN